VLLTKNALAANVHRGDSRDANSSKAGYLFS